MKDQELIRKIVEYLDAADQTARPEIRELAETYAARCRQVNAVLDRCADAIRRDFNSNAVMFAQQCDPPLLDQIEKLDFVRCDEWRAICEDYEWPSVARFNVDSVKKLRQAYLDVSSLNPLLEQWRQYVRTGTTEQKLSLLRRIMILDSDGKSWKSNLTELERTRMTELIEDAKQAIINNDTAKLSDIYLEMVSPKMTAEAPEKVIRKIERVLAAAESVSRRRHADKLLADMNDAYALFDVSKLTPLITRWDLLISDPDFQPDSVDLAQVQSARDWLNQRNREVVAEATQKQLLESLAFALDNHDPIAEVERLYFELRQYDMQIPDDVEERVLMNRSRTEEEAGRRYRLKLVISVLAVIGIAISCAIGLNWYQEAKRQGKIVEEVTSAVARHDFSTVLKQIQTLKKTDAVVAALPEIIRLNEEAMMLQDSYFASVRQFEAGMARAAALLQREINDKILNELSRVLRETAIYAATDSPQQTERYNALVIKKRDADAAFRRHCERNYVEKTTNIERALSLLYAMDASTKDGNSKLQAELDILSRRVDALADEKNVDLAVMDAAQKKFALTMKELREKIIVGQKALSLEDKLQSWTSIQNFEEILNEYQNQFPIEYAKYIRAVADIPLWKNLEAWTEFPWRSQRVTADLMKAVREMPGTAVWIPSLEILNKVNGDIKEYSLRIIPEKTRLASVLNSFNYFEFAFSGLAPGTHYYFYSQTLPLRSKEGFRFAADIEYKRGMKKNLTFTRVRLNDRMEWVTPRNPFLGQIKNLPETFASLLNYTDGGTIPSAMHYLELLKLVNDLDVAKGYADAERAFIESWERTIEAKMMNPMTRFMICRNILMSLIKLNSNAAPELEASLKLMLAPFDTVTNWDWLTPVFDNTMVSRMDSAVNGVKLRQILERAQAKQELATRTLSRSLRPAAFLKQDTAGGFNVTLLPIGKNATELWLVRNAGAGQIEFVVAAESSDGWKLDSAYHDAYYHGAVLFSPTDQIRTRDWVKSWLEKSNTSRLFWPDGWPLNRRGE